MVIEDVLFNIFLQFVIFVLAILFMSMFARYLTFKGAESTETFIIIAKPFFKIFSILVVPIQWVVSLITGTKGIVQKSESSLTVLEFLSDNPYKGWWNPIKKFGMFIADIIAPVLVTGMVWAATFFMLPETYASVMEGLDAWASLLGHPFDVQFLIDAKDIIVDIVWTRLIIGGAYENLLFFILYVFCFLFVFSPNFTHATYSEGDHLDIPKNLAHIPAMAFLLVAYNFIFALIDYTAYTEISALVNGIAMKLFFVWALVFVVYLAFLCVDKLIGIFFKKGT